MFTRSGLLTMAKLSRGYDKNSIKRADLAKALAHTPPAAASGDLSPRRPTSAVLAARSGPSTIPEAALQGASPLWLAITDPSPHGTGRSRFSPMEGTRRKGQRCTEGANLTQPRDLLVSLAALCQLVGVPRSPAVQRGTGHAPSTLGGEARYKMFVAACLRDVPSQWSRRAGPGKRQTYEMLSACSVSAIMSVPAEVRPTSGST